MPTTSKFTEARRAKILQVARIGASRRTCAKAAGIDHQTLSRWLERGEKADPASQWRKFYDDFTVAETDFPIRALTSVSNGLMDDPKLAMKVLERREPGFAPQIPQPMRAQQAVTIQLSLHDGTLPQLGSSSVTLPFKAMPPPTE